MHFISFYLCICGFPSVLSPPHGNQRLPAPPAGWRHSATAVPLLHSCTVAQCATVQLCSSATVPHQLVKSGNLTTHHLVKWSSLESQDKDPLIGEHHHAGRLKTAWMEILVQKPQSCHCISASSPSATFEHQTGHRRYAEGSGAKAMSGERGYIDVLCSFLSQPLARFECRWRP